MASNLCIHSFNVNGINNNTKRRAIFNKCRTKGGIWLLQETHSTTSDEQLWQLEWGSKVVFSHGSSNSRGVAILFPNINIDIIEINTDSVGRYISVKIKWHETEYVIVNCYAPTRDFRKQQLEFIDYVKNEILCFENQNIVIAGDFNFYKDIRLDKMDKISEKQDNHEYRRQVCSIVETLDLIDVWRFLNPDTRRYTWHSRGKASRLDYIFISEHLLNIVDKCDILPGIHSDHSILCLDFLTGSDNSKRGRGFWKFNNTLLHDLDFVKQLKTVIKDIARKQDHLEDKGLKWEIVKLDIRSFTIPYCIKQKKINKQFKQELEDKLHFLNLNVDDNPDSQELYEQFVSVKNQLESIGKQEANATMFRSKAKWIEEGEHNTKYFLTLEKKNYVNKVMSQLQIGSSTLTDPSEILEQQRVYFQKLYSEKLNLNDSTYTNDLQFFLSETTETLSEEQRQECDEIITEKELLTSLKALKNGKTPGSDGLTTDFYKFFWNDIKLLLLESYNYALKIGQLSIEQRRGILSLIPKKNKNRLFLKNWRPISLLNTDYKIIAKLLALRLRSVLPHIIDEDQTGYIKSRYIGQNIRIIEDICFYTEKEGLPGIILSIDFEKAFDTLNWNFMLTTLKKYNFGEYFIRWISILYKNIQAVVTNNGHASASFTLEKGIRQGCPLSAYLFLIAVELLAQKVRNSEDVQGIKIYEEFIKISQLADDTTCFLQNLKSLKATLKILERFGNCAGLKVNKEKTKAKYIGSLKNEDYYPHGLSWIKDNEHIETLGITCSCTDEENYFHNFRPRIVNLQNTLKIWKMRNLSLKGKITIINNLALAPLIYVSSIMDTPSKVFKEVKHLITDFLWNGKRPKIAFNTLKQEIDKGGLKLCDFEIKVKALLLSWVKRLTNHVKARWKLLPKYFYNTTSLKSHFSVKSQKINTLAIPKFYSTIYKYWLELYNREPSNGLQVQRESIWQNMYITSGGKSLNDVEWRCKGITHIVDLLNEDCHFYSHVEIQLKYNVKCNFLKLMQIRQSIPWSWRKMLQKCNVICKNDFDKEEIYLLINDRFREIHTLRCKDFYWALINMHNIIPSSVKKWQTIYPSFENCDPEIWKRIYRTSFEITRETKLQSFQYKLIHRTIPCNKWLCDIKVKDSNICTYCTETDNISHFFIDCEKVNIFWSSFFKWWNNASETTIMDIEHFEECILFGFPETNEIFMVLNYCILLAKFYIYRSRIFENNKIDLYQYLVILKNRLSIEKYICKKENKSNCFEKFAIIHEAI